MSFSFERSPFDGTIYFYKRDQDNPISKIDRVLMDYYEQPIAHIQRLPESVINEIPTGWRFGMEFFMNTNPVLISYQRMPKNNLVLTHITVRDQFGEIERTIVSKDELEYWADLLEIEAPPIIFQGKLSDEQKVSINDFVNSPNDSLKIEHGTDSFAKYLITVLNPDLDRSFLNNSLDEPIEGVVFRFGTIDGMGEAFTAKILDPIFHDMTKSNNLKKTSYLPSDIYGISLLEVMNFILDKGIDTFSYQGEEPNDKYMSFICSVFNSFILENGEKYLGLDLQEPEYLKQIGSVNLDLIPDQNTRETIANEESYKSLFKMMLSAFRKIKKKTGGFFTQGAVEQFNILVREITEYLNRKPIVVESAIPTFDQFRKVKKVFVPEEEEEKDDDEEENIEPEEVHPEVKEIPVTENPVEDIEDEVEEKEPEEDVEDEVEDDEEEVAPTEPEINDRIKSILTGGTGEKEDADKPRVNLAIGKFHPFNNGHYNLVKKAHQHNGLPVCLFVVHKNNGEIDPDTMHKMISLVANDLGDIIHSVYYVENDLLSTAIHGMDQDVIPKSLTVGKNKIDNYLLQSRSLKKKGAIPKDFQIQGSPEWVASHEVNATLRDKDYLGFKKKVPKSIHSLWEELSRKFSK
jgi:hypothetical protein